VAIPADVPDDLPITTVQIVGLPAHWRAVPPPKELHDVGRTWHAAGRTAIASLPSAVVPIERNYILNPSHGDFRRIRVGRPIEFSFDPRMWK
jgi:RES domain-containing protein